MYAQGKAMFLTLCTVLCVMLTGCQPPKQTQQALQVDTVAVKNKPYSGERYRVALGKFENRSPYMNGIFSDKKDKLGMQAKTNLAAHVAMSNRFVIMDRTNIGELALEADISGKTQKITGAQIVLTGMVTEFGRREIGIMGLGGILQRKRTQIAYAKVTVNAVDVRTSQIVYSAQGAGEVEVSNEHVLGFGTEAGYDPTLVDKVLNLAMIEVVNRLVEGLENGSWKPPEEGPETPDVPAQNVKNNI
ncbi:MAG: CsgG/HfaB family protein [Phycisphaeraceae bacterium]|nr:CsgG/HfaB family protein [Phycisphaeraceae bacterium]